MRILILSYFFPPLNSVSSRRPYSWAVHWSEAGHQVTVLTARRRLIATDIADAPAIGFTVMPLPTLNLYEWFRARLIGRKPDVAGSHAGQRLVRFFLGGSGLLFHRFPSMIDTWFVPAVRWLNGQGNWDLVISTYGPYVGHVLGYWLKRSGRARRWVADYRDLWTDAHIYHGLFPFSALERMAERSVNRRADLITTVSSSLADRLVRANPGTRVAVIENGFEDGPPPEGEGQPVFPDDRKVRLVYTGSVYAGHQDPSPLFQAIRLLADDPAVRPLLDRVEILFVGLDPGNVPELINRYGVGRWARHGGQVGHRTALKMQRQAHALVYLGWRDPGYDGILTGKLYEYLSSGTEIWALGVERHSEAGRLLEVSGVARFFDQNAPCLRRAIERLARVGVKRPATMSPDATGRYSRRTLALRLLSEAIAS